MNKNSFIDLIVKCATRAKTKLTIENIDFPRPLFYIDADVFIAALEEEREIEVRVRLNEYMDISPNEEEK